MHPSTCTMSRMAAHSLCVLGPSDKGVKNKYPTVYLIMWACLVPHLTIICSTRAQLWPFRHQVNGKVSLDLSGNGSVPANLEWPSIAPDGQPDRSRAHAWMDCMCSDRTTARICLDLAFRVRPRSLTAMFCISVPGRQDSSALFCKTSRQKLW